MKKYLILGSLVVIAGVVINYSLGGFKPVTPELITTNGNTFYGWPYEGSYSSDSLNTQVEILRNIINEPGNDGTLTIVNYIIPELEKRGVVRQFIGIEWRNGKHLSTYPLDSLHIDPYNGIQFVIPVRPLVMPSPEKLKDLASEAAHTMATELQGFSIEQYKDKTLILNFPLK